MQVTKSTIFGLFQMEKRHLVPLFQRAYVWNKEAQWKPLWENIRDKANEVAANEMGLSTKTPSLHFLGAIVRSPFQTTGAQIASNLLIDGQQRLTTLQVVLFALRDYIKTVPEYTAPGHSVVVKLITENQTALDPTQTQERYKVWPTNADRPAFQKIIDAGSPDALKASLPPQKMYYNKPVPAYPLTVQAYLFFYEEIVNFVEKQDEEDASDETETPTTRLAALVKTLQNFMELVVIDLEGDEDPQVIFETLNARGVKLLPSDLVRNFVFWEATHSKEDAALLHGKYWEPYDTAPDEFWKTVQQQGRIRRPRIDLFLFQYLVYKTRNEVSITDLFNEFRKWWQAEPRQVEAELQRLQQFSHVFRELMAPTKQSRFALFARRARVLDAGTLYPLLLFLQGESHPALSSDDLDAIAVHLESYLVRRMVCGLTTKRYNLTFLGLLRHVTNGKNVLSPQVIADYLAGLKGDSSRWPDDAEFKTAWLNRPVYYYLPQGRVVMVLLALDLQMTTNKHLEVYVQGTPTVEHIMPQNGSETDWPLGVDTSTMTAQEAEAAVDKAKGDRANLLHTFGNLTLLTQALNSSVSNGPFGKKRPEIAHHATSLLNTYFQDTGDTWDEAAIRTRGEKLFETALEIWPKP